MCDRFAVNYFTRLFILVYVASSWCIIAFGAASSSLGDEDPECLKSPNRPSTINQNILLASFNYANLLESDGGPWAVVDEDQNNDLMAGNSTPTVWLRFS